MDPVGRADGEASFQLTKKHTFEDTDGSAKVVDPSGGLEGGGKHRGGGDEIVGEGVVEVALWFGDKPKSHTTFSEAGRRASKLKARGAGLPEARKRPGHRQTPSRTCRASWFSH